MLEKLSRLSIAIILCHLQAGPGHSARSALSGGQRSSRKRIYNAVYRSQLGNEPNYRQMRVFVLAFVRRRFALNADRCEQAKRKFESRLRSCLCPRSTISHKGSNIRRIDKN